MKILVISNLYPPHEIGGYEIRCRDFCERAATYGHDVHVLTSDHHVTGRTEIPQPQVYRKLKIHGMYGHPWLGIAALRKLEKHNHEKLLEQLEISRPDIIHVWNMGGVSKSLLLRLEAGETPVVYDVSDHWIARSLRADVWLQWWNIKGSPGRSIARKTLEILGVRKLINPATPTAAWKNLKFKRIYFCSAFMRDFTASKGWPVSHGGIIHCGIETKGFVVKKNHSPFTKLMWVGRLSGDKDPLTAIRALAAAHRDGLTHLTLDLYGNGDAEYIGQVDAEIIALGLAGHVFRKLAPAAEMRKLYSEYDALIFTSNWGEPFALTPLEAMASGLPVITSLDGGQKELARHGINCLVAAAGEPEVYAAQIAEMSASPQLRESIAATGLEEARTQFDFGTISRQIEAFLLASLES